MTLVMYILFACIIYYLTYLWNTYNYWKKKGVVGPTPLPWFGNYASVILRYESEAEFIRKIYEKYPNEKFIGIYKGVIPALIVKDLDTIKQVMVKDLHAFKTRCIEKPHKHYNKSLFSIDADDVWHNLRHINSPVFTKVRLVKMTPLIMKTIDNLIKNIDSLENQRTFEMKALFSIYSFDMVKNAILGVEFLDQQLKSTMDDIMKSQTRQSTRHILANIFPQIMSIARPMIQYYYHKSLIKSLYDFILTCLNSNQNNVNTVLGFMKELRLQIESNPKLKMIDENVICQQIITYSIAVYEIIAYNTALIMYKLAMHEDIQKLCYQEVKAIDRKYQGEVSWDSVSEMTYFDMVFNEILRMYPGNVTIDRKCTVSKYRFPGTNIVVDKDTFVFFTTIGLNHDPKYFSNPEVFDPVRFSAENKAKMIPGVYLPFGEGPRNCIGKRFSKYVIAATIFCLLRKYKVVKCDKTKENMNLDPGNILISRLMGGFWATLEPRIIHPES